MTSPLTMTRAEIARDLQVTERTIDRLWRRGEFPKPYRVGSALRWHRAEVAAALERSRAV